MEWFLLAVAAALGMTLGSFLNVCLDRLPARQSLFTPASRCPGCQTLLRPLELVPVFSYLSQGGRCRHCPSRIPIRVFLLELATGATGAALWQWYGLSQPVIATVETLLTMSGLLA
jgi:leader peptidase (prepilin peptidase)/N-methyltransferase